MAAKKPVPETFGQRLRRLRAARGLNVSQLATAVGVTEGAIRQIELGQTKQPSFAVGIRIAALLSIEPRDLAFGEGDGTDLAPDAIALPESRVDVLEKRVAALIQRVVALERRR